MPLTSHSPVAEIPVVPTMGPMRRILRLSRKGTVKVPAALRRKMGWGTDAEVVAELTPGGLLLTPKPRLRLMNASVAAAKLTKADLDKARLIPKAKISGWVRQDEADMARLRRERAGRNR